MALGTSRDDLQAPNFQIINLNEFSNYAQCRNSNFISRSDRDVSCISRKDLLLLLKTCCRVIAIYKYTNTFKKIILNSCYLIKVLRFTEEGFLNII